MRSIYRFLAIAVIIAAVITSAVFIAEENNKNKVESPTDYSDPGNWMYAQTDAKYDADLFFIYPTSAMVSDRDDGCANITEEAKATAKDTYTWSSNAFSGYTNIFEPYYRQVSSDTVGGFTTYDETYNFIKNSVATKDIYASLDYYFENYNNGRPFILAGHSQGSSLLLIVLEDYMSEHPEYYSRMIAAYAIGFGVEQDYLDRNTHIKFANSATDTGVLISWNTEGVPSDGIYKQNFLIGKNCQNINPLTWSRDTALADKSLNKGEYKLLDDGTVTTVPGVNDARINAERGSLICTTNTNFLPNGNMGDVSLHVYDYKLYYKDIQINGADRVAAYLAQ